MKKKLIHHGSCEGEIHPKYSGTDYFHFYHKCSEDDTYGYCHITAILIDNRGRCIFNLRCSSCGFEDALKTTPRLWRHDVSEDDAVNHYHLSPNLKKRVKRHGWDNL